jgi:glycosyltransferase involved in cell wall biosynthesis
MNFTNKRVDLDYTPVFSILIPSWNNLDYLKYAIASIRKNSRFKHQIIVHINEGKDGTEEWDLAQGDI